MREMIDFDNPSSFPKELQMWDARFEDYIRNRISLEGVTEWWQIEHQLQDLCLKESNSVVDFLNNNLETEVAVWHCTRVLNEEDFWRNGIIVSGGRGCLGEKRIRLFYEITKNLYLEYRLSEMNKFTENQEKGIWEFLGRKEFQENQEVVTNEFKNALKVGYEQGKDQNILKEKYIDVLNDACKVIDLTLAGCAACIENQIDIIEAIQKANAESDSKGFDGLNGTMPGIVSVLQTNIKFLEYAKQRISDMFLKHGYNRYQTDYLKEVMFNAWFDRAQKLKKNDIFDMLCAGCLGYIRPLKQGEVILANTNSYIISFDSTMEKYIHIVRPDNIKLIQKFKNKI